MPKSGDVFGRLTVVCIDSLRQEKSRKKYFKCSCSCGNLASVRIDHLNAMKILSCGCWHDEAAVLINTKHGHKHRGNSTPEYTSWAGMLGRCNDKNLKCYKYYGGRGIKVCEKWSNDFIAFLKDVGPRPCAGMSIDRIDVNGDYEPKNVRWADAKTQARNVRNRKEISAFGERLTIAEWAERIGVDKRRIHWRIKRGWHPEKAIGELINGRA
jgi:hypothetical protein